MFDVGLESHIGLQIFYFVWRV